MRALAMVLAMASAACSPVARDPALAAPTAPVGATCDAAAVQDLVGKPLATSQAEAQRRAGAATVRAYASGAAVTMDYRADRLNIETDAAGLIVKISCG